MSVSVSIHRGACKPYWRAEVFSLSSPRSHEGVGRVGVNGDLRQTCCIKGKVLVHAGGLKCNKRPLWMSGLLLPMFVVAGFYLP